ncbi:3-oxoadipate CoA-transferase subunit B [Clostridium aceticum]|uniref:3-oxoadipate CoA-transferase subunit B n=1 Tax=Clostridium aceticum TaxID=84022 RepID=A0A0D8IEN9_9CLOT|nr:CoA-transferase [Clostridium aceticum]AKL93867.1 3-oxoadipate CoA-transferase subunit B [Clostridium aceticum]KJF28738.1 CoA-transferase [Clostridium aceticum]
MEYKPSDMMAITIARMLKNGETVFHGVASPLPMVAILLAKALHAPHLVYLNIAGGVDAEPKPLPRSTDAPVLLRGTKAVFKLEEVFDLSARGGLDVAFLSGVQIDAMGKINSSVIGEYHKPKVRLPGGAGSACLLPTAKKAIIWRSKHDQKAFVEKCDFVTAQGNIHRVVTPLCVFKKEERGLVLESVHPYTTLEEVQENTGFPIVYDSLQFTPPPTLEELKTLNEVDPSGIREIEFS